MTIDFERAMEIYDSKDRHSMAISALVAEANRVRITDKMISDAMWEMGGTKEQAWRVVACVLRAGGFEVIE